MLTMLIKLLPLLVVCLLNLRCVAGIPVECNDDEICESDIGLRSTCRPDGFCSNPFESGCLSAMQVPRFKNRTRVCNSDDPPNAHENGICRQPDIDYLEIRLFSQNWESPVFEDWLLQIILSELLGVPTTIETGAFDAKVSLYDKHMRFDYGTSSDTNSLQVATKYDGDCSRAARGDSAETYEYCAHFIPEVWNVQTTWVRELIHTGVIEPPRALGTLGQEGMYVTKFTAEEHPDVTSYLGLKGEKNREKLAGLFKRPTTWKDYCEQVSENNCTTPDRTAKRGPENDWENHRLFVEDIYTGYFRYTDRNNCTKFPHNCTGHFADYPCGWSNYVQGQFYYLNIALESNGNEPGSGGYSYSQLTEVWRAANATRENLMMYWYTPDATYQKFLETDSEFQRVAFQPPTQKCVDSRSLVSERCSPNLTERAGSPDSICDETPQPLSKLLSSGLPKAINDPSIPPALVSPALEVLELFTISELQLGELIDAWQRTPTPREAVCRWAADNVEYLESFIPDSYPRVVRDGEKNMWLIFLPTILGGVTLLLVLLTTIIVCTQKGRNVMKVAQIEFMMLLLAGSFLISIGAILMGAEPTDATCAAIPWLINMGYTLELVPLIVKVAAIVKLVNAARQMRRVVLGRRRLLFSVFSFSFLVIPFLIAWSVIDPPTRDLEYSLSEDKTTTEGGGEVIVYYSYHCASESAAWSYASNGWNLLLLIIATVLAFQLRNLKSAFNESWTLGILVYSHFIFVCLRIVTFFLVNSVSRVILEKVQSLIFSFDTIATLIIYFLPKFFADDNSSLSCDSSTFAKSTRTLSPSNEFVPGSKRNSADPDDTAPQHQSRKISIDNKRMVSCPCPKCGETITESMANLLKNEVPT